MQTFALVSVLVLLFGTASGMCQSLQPSDVNADVLVEQGLAILGKNEFGTSYAHGLRPFRFEVPKYGSEIERFQIAVNKFQRALLHEKTLASYEPIDVHGFLAIAYCRLAKAINGSPLPDPTDILHRNIAYAACFAEFERAIKNGRRGLTSARAYSYVKSIIESGDYALAIMKIGELRKSALSAPRFSTRDFFYLEGDAYFQLGDRKRAGLAYDRWLRSMSGNFAPSQEVIARLEELNKDVGLPTAISIARLNSSR